MELFESAAADKHEPLAYRMRPRSLDEFAGQKHIVGTGRLLRRVIQADQLSSLIFYGPPGTGKTTLAWVIASTTRSNFITMNAVLSGVKELRVAIEEAKNQRDLYGKRTTLFVDEVHRWNKAQQDALLPWVENGTVILIGATTQNPYFEVNPALVSRSRVFQLKPLEDQDLEEVARRALEDPERGYGKLEVSITDDALRHLVRIANGDARSLLNALELAVETTPEQFPPPKGTVIEITLETAEESIQRKVVLYDKEGDYHFDTISAFIKSVRGSDPDATLYWLARMVHAGEDPHFIFRRMLISASEDVGLADPYALGVVESAAAAFDRVGMPEGRYHLAHAALYLSTCPKSNTTMGFFDALAYLESEAEIGEVPNHLRDDSRDREGFGHGEGYLYPHAFRDHWVAQQYLPTALQGRMFYEPSTVGYEARIRDEVLRKREVQLAQAVEPPSAEVLTFSPPDRNREQWLSRISGERSAMLETVRRRVFEGLQVARHDRIIDLNAKSGLLLWEALRRVPEGGVWGVVRLETEAEIIRHQARNLPEGERPTVLVAGKDLSVLEGLETEAAIGRNVLPLFGGWKLLFETLSALLVEGGKFSIAESVPSLSPRLSRLLGPLASAEEQQDVAAFASVEEEIYSQALGELASWDPQIMVDRCKEAGFRQVNASSERFPERRVVTKQQIESWFNAGSSYGSALAERVSNAERERLKSLLEKRLAGRELDWPSTVAFLTGVR